MNPADMFEQAGIFKALLDMNTDSVMCVSDLQTYTWVEYSPHFDLGVRVGDVVKSGSVLGDCMAKGEPVKRTMDSSLYGIPYIAMAVPLRDGDVVTGGVVWCQSTKHQQSLLDAAHELSSMTQQLASTSETFAQDAESLADSNRQILRLMDNVSQSVNSISDVNEVVSYIARQTNLIGLNAVIEAAHAGHAGAGFSIVANEIRKLAQQAGSSTEEVSGNLVEMLNHMKTLNAQAGVISSFAQNQAAGAEELRAMVEQVAQTAMLLTELTK